MNARLFLPAVPGRHRREALFVFRTAIDAGMSWKRARVLAAAASLGQQFWGFQGTLAEFVGCGLATVQRAFDQAKRFGLLFSRRNREGELTPSGKFLKCGFALRTFTTWGLRSLRRIAMICGQHASRDMWRRAAAAEKARQKAEMVEAVAEFQALRP